MTIHILGCDHYLQPYELCEYMEECRQIERELKEKFYGIVNDILKTNGIVFVGEECKPGQDTIPRALAVENKCEYAEIDMPIEERRRQAIPDNYPDLGEK